MISAAGLSLCFILAAALLSTGTQGAAFGATAMVFIFQIFLGIGYLPIVSVISDMTYPVLLIGLIYENSHGFTLLRFVTFLKR